MKNSTIAVIMSSYTCNMQCKFCRLSKINDDFKRPQYLMSVETLNNIIKQENPSGIVVTGGEPFLNIPLLMDLSQKKIAVKIHTNGTILWPLNYWPDNFRLNISESCEDYTALYQYLMDSKLTKPILQFVITPDNFEKILEKIKNLDTSTILGFHISLDHWMQWSEENEKFVKMIAKELAGMHLESNLLYQLFFSDEEEHQTVKKFTPSGVLTNTIWSGDVPSPDKEKLESQIFLDRRIYNGNGNKKIIYKGAFNIPYEYYQSLLFKEMRKYAVAQT